jgi:hypothetical protein
VNELPKRNCRGALWAPFFLKSTNFGGHRPPLQSKLDFSYDDRAFSVCFEEEEMHDFLISLENTPVSIFIRESSSFLAFPAVLTTHAFGYCFIVATNMIVSARMLGFAKTIPLKPLRRLFPVMWVGLILTVITGLLLVMAAAEKRAPNPILWVKMGLLAIATPMMWKYQMKVFTDPAIDGNNIPASARAIAIWQIALWIFIMIGGRLIPYSATILGEGY